MAAAKPADPGDPAAAAVELVYFDGCPSLPAARERLTAALAAVGRPATWREWCVGRDELPAHLQGYGSPTIVVAGREVTAEAPGETASCCRVYREADGQLSGAPPVEVLVAALRAAASA